MERGRITIGVLIIFAILSLLRGCQHSGRWFEEALSGKSTGDYQVWRP
jgi:hypothetical protein